MFAASKRYPNLREQACRFVALPIVARLNMPSPRRLCHQEAEALTNPTPHFFISSSTWVVVWNEWSSKHAANKHPPGIGIWIGSTYLEEIPPNIDVYS
jgi:hypothetical protein